MQVVASFASAPTEAQTPTVWCSDDPGGDVGDMKGSHLKITAIRLGSLSNVPLP